MNEETPNTPTANNSEGSTANIIYILHLSSLILGITAIIGVVMAYMNRKDAPEWLQSHYTYQIHTFWKTLLYSFIAMILTFVIIGIFVMLGVVVWFIIRNVKGMKALSMNQPIENPTSWWL